MRIAYLYIAGVSTEKGTISGYYQKIAYLFQYAEGVLLAADQSSHIIYKIQLLGPGEQKEEGSGLDRWVLPAFLLDEAVAY